MHKIKSLISITADDYGLHPSINKAIISCAKQEALQRISVCANGSYIDWDCLKTLQTNGLHIGAHITLVGEKWHTRPYFFTSWRSFIFRLFFSPSTFIEKLQKEIQWQLDQFTCHGLKINHIDSHQHVHVLPKLWPIFYRLALRNHIPAIRIPYVPSFASLKLSFSHLFLQVLSLYRKRTCALAHTPCLGIAHSGRNTAKTFSRECRHVTQQTEFILHPGDDNRALNEHYPSWRFDWEGELSLIHYCLSLPFAKSFL
ncbi:MAG: ChbG/HpnK family deacetylase [bacterium]